MKNYFYRLTDEDMWTKSLQSDNDTTCNLAWLDYTGTVETLGAASCVTVFA